MYPSAVQIKQNLRREGYWHEASVLRISEIKAKATTASSKRRQVIVYAGDSRDIHSVNSIN